MESLRPKSGLGDDKNEALDDIKIRLVGLICVMVKQATRASMLFCSHQGRTVVTEEDTIKGLKYTAMNFFSSESLEEDLDHMLSDFDSLDDSTQYDDIVERILDDVDSTTETTSIQDCSCDLCVGMTNIESNFDAWDPEDEAEKFLKNHLVEFNRHSEESIL